MKKILLLILIAAISMPLAGQTGRGKKKKKKPRNELTKRPESQSEIWDRVWVGGNISDLSIFNNTFRFGLTPLVGIQLNKVVTMGPMVRMAYRSQGFTDPRNGQRISLNTFDVGPGAYARFDFLQQFFAHLEYESAFLEREIYDQFGNLIIEGGDKIATESIRQNYLYVGLGYASGGPKLKFMTSIHYNVLDDIDYVRFPWDFRFGVRYLIGIPPPVPVEESSLNRQR